MRTQIQLFKSQEHGKVRGFADCNGTVFLNVTDVARGLNFVNKKGIARLKVINKLLKRFNYGSEVNGDDYIPENMFYRLAMKADNAAANSFQAYLADEVIPSIRRTGRYEIGSQNSNLFTSTPALPSCDIRQSNIDTRKSFTSIVQLYIYYARNQGDTRPKENLFAKFSNLANQTAGIQKGCRPSADNEKQLKCKMAENLMGNEILDGMHEGKFFANIECDIIRKIRDMQSLFTPQLPLLTA